MKMYFVYILQSPKDRRTYVGYTPDLAARLHGHNAGQVKSTKHRRPLELLFSEKFASAQEAKKRERWWKSGAGRRKLKEFFKKQKI